MVSRRARRRRAASQAVFSRRCSLTSVMKSFAYSRKSLSSSAERLRTTRFFVPDCTVNPSYLEKDRYLYGERIFLCSIRRISMTKSSKLRSKRKALSVPSFMCTFTFLPSKQQRRMTEQPICLPLFGSIGLNFMMVPSSKSVSGFVFFECNRVVDRSLVFASCCVCAFLVIKAELK